MISLRQLIEHIVERCIRYHGGFAHGNAVRFCPRCAQVLDILEEVVVEKTS
jgi:hypothetical protein